MKTWKKITLGLFGLGLVLVVFIIYKLHIFRTQTMPDCYAQWATAEMVLAFREARNEMPKGWSDLEPYSTLALHHGGLSFSEIRNRIKINFVELPKLANSYNNQSDIPQVIQTASGTDSHWGGAEPNQLVNSMINKPQEPNN